MSEGDLSRNELPEGQMFECYHCWYKTKNKASLEDHMRTHLVKKPYSCAVCNFTASQKNYLLQHQKAHAVFGCSLCDYKSYDKTRVKDHLTKAHRTPKVERLYRCHVCGYETTDESKLTRHFSKHDENPYECKICGLNTQQKRSLTAHMGSAHPDVKPYACDVCDYKSNCPKNLRKHKIRHSTSKPYSCDQCDFRAVCKDAVRSHQKIHGDRPFGCNICGYRSYSKSNVNDHMKIHTGEKPLTCDFCPYSTRKKSDLTRHMKVHSTKKKPYKCVYCSHRTNEKYTLEAHMLTHTGEHPFVCSVCAKGYFRKSALSDHVVRCHADKEDVSYKCKSCDFVGVRPLDVTNHILANHAAPPPEPGETVEVSLQPLAPLAMENVGMNEYLPLSQMMNETSEGDELVPTNTTDGAILVTTENPVLQTLLTEDVYRTQFDDTKA